MNTTVQHEDAEIGYVWGTNGDTHYLRNADGEFRGVSENAVKMLEDVATGEVDEADLPDDAATVVERLRADGFIRPSGVVSRVDPPEDISFLPRAILFGLIAGIVLIVAGERLMSIHAVSMERLLTPFNLAVVAAMGVVRIAVHEAGHHLAGRRHMDASVRMGTINGILPAVISDTSDAWFLPKNRRLWINLAGPFYEGVWLLSLIVVHYAFFPDVFVLKVAIILFYASLVTSLNPLFHGDGYWIMVDLLGIVNLRSRGIADLLDWQLTVPSAYVVASYGFAAVTLFFVTSTLAASGPVGIALVAVIALFIAYFVREEVWTVLRWTARRAA